MALIDLYNDGYDAAQRAMENNTASTRRLASTMRAASSRGDAGSILRNDERGRHLRKKIPSSPEMSSAFRKGLLDALLDEPRREELKGVLGKFE